MTAPILSLVMPFYMNRGILAAHYETWASYPDALKASIEAVIVDDGSPDGEDALGVPRPDGLPSVRIYKVREDRPWHQHAARNLGAFEAAAPWLLITDMDHVLPADMLEPMICLCNYDVVTTFGRVDAPDGRPTMKNGQRHPHPNTFLMSKDRFWRIGGYDEDLVGYGTDGFFRTRVAASGVPVSHRCDITLVRYPREVIADASTRTLPRKDGRPADQRVRNRIIAEQKARDGRAPTVLNFEWSRVL